MHYHASLATTRPWRKRLSSLVLMNCPLMQRILVERPEEILCYQVLNWTLPGSPNCVSSEKMKPNFTWRHKLSVDQGRALWGMHVIIPLSLRNGLLQELHERTSWYCCNKSNCPQLHLLAKFECWNWVDWENLWSLSSSAEHTHVWGAVCAKKQIARANLNR